MSDRLVMWTIYDRPADFPDQAIAREWRIDEYAAVATGQVILAPSLEKLRALLPQGLVCIPRAADDDPVILESWL